MDLKQELVEHQTKIQMALEKDHDRLDFLISEKIKITEQLSEFENKLAPFRIKKKHLETELEEKNASLRALKNTRLNEEKQYQSSLKIIHTHEYIEKNQQNLESILEALKEQKEAIENQIDHLQNKYPNTSEPSIDISMQHNEIRQALADKESELAIISKKYDKMIKLQTSQYTLIQMFIKFFRALRGKPHPEKLRAQLINLEREAQKLSEQLKEYDDLITLHQLKEKNLDIFTEQADLEKLMETKEIVENHSQKQADLDQNIKNTTDTKLAIEKKLATVTKKFNEVDKLVLEKNKIEQEWHKLDSQSRARPESIKKLIQGLIKIYDHRQKFLDQKIQRPAGKNNQLFKEHVEKNQPATQNIINQTSLRRLDHTIEIFLAELDKSTAEYKILMGIRNAFLKYQFNNVGSEFSMERSNAIKTDINKLISDLPADNPLHAAKNYINNELMQQPESELAPSQSFKRK